MKGTYNTTSKIVHVSGLSPDKVEDQLRKDIDRLLSGATSNEDMRLGVYALYPELLCTKYDSDLANIFTTIDAVKDKLRTLTLNQLKEIFHMEVQHIEGNGTTHFRVTFGNSLGTRQDLIEKGILVEQYLI